MKRRIAAKQKRVRRLGAGLTCLALLLLASPLARGQSDFSVQLVFGLADSPESWRGSLSVENAEVEEMRGWLLRRGDQVAAGRFFLQTRHPARPEPIAKGLLIRGTSTPGGELLVSTDRGNFRVPVGALVPGESRDFVGGAARATALFPAEKLSDDLRDDDYPSVAVENPASAWVVWQSYSGRRDEIRLRHFDGEWKTFTYVPGVSGDVWRPKAVLDGRGRLWIIWSQQQDGNFDIFARALEMKSNRWGELRRLSSDAGPDIDLDAVSDGDGSLWVAWQGFRNGNSEILLRQFDGERWSHEVNVSDDPANDWEPRMALDQGKRAHIVWDSYRNGNYDVFLRASSEGRLGRSVAVTDSPRMEAHASVAVDRAGRVWVAWDEAGANWAKDSGPTIDPAWRERGSELWSTWINEPSEPGERLYESRKLNLAIFEGGVRREPVAELQVALHDAGIPDHDGPQLSVDSHSGRVAVLFHRWNHERWTESLGFRPVYWEQAVIFYENDRWSAVHSLPESWGRVSMRAAGAFAADGTYWAAWPGDGRLDRRPASELIGNVFAARLPASAGSGGPKVREAPAIVSEAVAAVHPNEERDVAAVREYRAVVRGIDHQIVRGDLHRHTEFSWDSSGGMVDGSLFDFYRYMLDAAAMDFGAVTDHNGGGDYEYWWWLTEKSVDMFTVPGGFAPLYGYERSISYPFGHRNVLHTRRGVPVVSFFTKPEFSSPRPAIAALGETVVANDTRLLHESLRQSGGLSIPHTSGSNMGTNWADSDPAVEPVVEVFQGDRISYEHPGAPRAPRSADDKPIGGYQEDGFVWRAYEKGIRLGMIASSDHWSTHLSYAMVYTEAPARQAIFDAIKKRRTYGATDNIILDYRLGDGFMGEELTVAALPPLEITAIGTAPIERIDIVRNERVIHSIRPDARRASLSYLDAEPQPGVSYYYVRVLQSDRHVAWGSPIWVQLEP